MASIAMIACTSPEICQTDHFLDSLKWVEENMGPPNVTDYGIPSPVFREPQDPYPHYDVYHYLFSTMCISHVSPPNYSHPRNPKINYKHHNKQFRKRGHLKQPGGASCNQRR